MSEFKIVAIIGCRPQFVKAGPVSRAIMAFNDQGTSVTLREVLVHTGQHYDEEMSDVFFRQLRIKPPDYYLGVGSGSHGAQTGGMMAKLEPILRSEDPAIAVVYGDTNSTLAGALAAAKLQIPVAHVEAGLRSFNRNMPEEINRVVVDHLAKILFAPTQTAVANLADEGIREGVFRVGDVMFDAMRLHFTEAEGRPSILSQLGVERHNYGLVTIHRSENTDDVVRLRSVFSALSTLSGELTLILPLHPRTRAALSKVGQVWPPGLRIIEPVSYLDMLVLEANAKIILTDSGGVQKEAMFFKVPCVTLRDETEWVETLETGWNVLAGTVPDRIVACARNLRPGRENEDLFGEPEPSRRIVEVLAGHLDRRLELNARDFSGKQT